jgi:hypothetical protein
MPRSAEQALLGSAHVCFVSVEEIGSQALHSAAQITLSPTIFSIV